MSGEAIKSRTAQTAPQTAGKKAEETGQTDKRAFFLLAEILLTAGILIAGFVFCVDPFYHYHEPWFGLPAILDDQVYQSPGAARHLPYDSLILGSSMTENFHASWFDEMGWDTLKLSYSGARTDDLRAMLDYIYRGDVSPSHIVMDLNTFQLTSPADSSFGERPGWLYDDNPLTDVSYLYNRDVLKACVLRIADGLEGRGDNLDDAYTWEDDFYFGKRRVMESYLPTRELLTGKDFPSPDLSEMLRVCDENLDNLTPFLEAHPETRFYIYYPPYSILYWEEEVLENDLAEILTVYCHAAGRLLSYGNVEQFYFQDELEKISDLDRYRDITHHCPEYNRYIFECIRDGKKRVTEQNLPEMVRSVYDYVNNYDFDALWAQEGVS